MNYVWPVVFLSLSVVFQVVYEDADEEELNRSQVQRLLWTSSVPSAKVTQCCKFSGVPASALRSANSSSSSSSASGKKVSTPGSTGASGGRRGRKPSSDGGSGSASGSGSGKKGRGSKRATPNTSEEAAVDEGMDVDGLFGGLVAYDDDQDSLASDFATGLVRSEL